MLHRGLLAPTLHPSLEEPSLVGYLWRSCFRPRLNYEGRPLSLPAPVADVAFDADRLV